MSFMPIRFHRQWEIVFPLFEPPQSAQNSRFREEFDHIELISKGAFGHVYQAEKKMENKKYAVKCIRLWENNEEMMQDSTREVKVLSAIKHRNIVFYYNAWSEKHPPPDWQDGDSDEETGDSSSESGDISFDSRRLEEAEQRYENSSITSDSNSDVSFRVGTNDHRYLEDRVSHAILQHWKSSFRPSVTYLYIQMELCRQENLAHWLKNRKPKELKVYQMYRAILSAVNYLHSQDLVHRDLKPNNIFFDVDWSIKVGDFGLSKRMTTDGEYQSVSLADEHQQTDSVDSRMNHTFYIGTKPYMAPEQERYQTYNHKVDVYALAIILFELMMGPFKTDSERADSISKLKSFQLPQDFECNAKLKQLLYTMLSIDPDKRPEVKDILSEHFPKEVKELNPSPPKPRKAIASARAPIRHPGDVFHSKLLMLFLIRGIGRGYQFQLGADMFGMGGRFDDLIFKYRLNSSAATNSSWRYRFVQAKYKQDEAFKITAKQLLDKNSGDFSLAKYFRSYLHIRRRGYDTHDCIICTNIGFDVNNLTKNGFQLVNVDPLDDILAFENLNRGNKPARYRLQITDQLRQTFTTNWSDIYLLAENLRRYAQANKPLALQHDVFKRYHVALVNERVIDLETKKFHLDFVNAANLSSGATQLRQIILKLTGKEVDLINWKFKLGIDFGKSSKKTVDYFPQTITNKDLDGFFDKLVFAVESPNIAKLDQILTAEIGQHFKLLGPQMLQRVWELSCQKFFLSEDGQKLLEENKQAMILIHLTSLSIDYRDRLRKFYCQDKPEDLKHLRKELNRFLCHSSEKNIHFLRLTTTCPKTTAVKLFWALDSLRDFGKGDAYLTVSSKRFADTDEMEQWKKALEAGPYQLLVVVCIDNVQFHEIYDKLIASGALKKKVVIISKNQELTKSGSCRLKPPLTSDGWKEIKDHPWPSLELECIHMYVVEQIKPEACGNIFRLLTEPSKTKIAVLFVQGKMNESFSCLQRVMPQTYEIIDNQTKSLNSEGFAAIIVDRSLDYQRILPSRIPGNPRHIAGIQLSYNGSLLSLYSVYRSPESIDPFCESDLTCAKTVLCTNPLASHTSNPKYKYKNLATPEGDNIRHGVDLLIKNLERLVPDSGNPYIRFSVL